MSGEENRIWVSVNALRQILGGLPRIRELFFEYIATGNVSGMKVLIAAGADLNARRNDKRYGNNLTPLMTAVAYGQVECTRSLISWGARLEERDPFGRTALVWAVTQYPDDKSIVVAGRVECAKLLIRAGSDVMARCGRWSVLDHAQRNEHSGYESCVRLLKKAVRRNASATYPTNG